MSLISLYPFYYFICPLPIPHSQLVFLPPLTRSLARSLTHSLAHSHTYSLTHSLTHSITQSLNHSITRSFTRSLTYSLTHSLTHSFTLFSIVCLYVSSRTAWLYVFAVSLLLCLSRAFPSVSHKFLCLDVYGSSVGRYIFSDNCPGIVDCLTYCFPDSNGITDATSLCLKEQYLSACQPGSHDMLTTCRHIIS